MSFSSRVKQDILSLKFKNKCCKKAFFYGAIFGADISDGDLTVKLSDSECADFMTYVLSTVFKVREVDITETKRGFCNMITLKFSLPTGTKLLADIDNGIDTEGAFNEIFACQSCKYYFFGGLFCATGTVSDPEKSYSLELALPNLQRAERIARIFAKNTELTPGMTRRKNGYGLFFRNSDSVGEFLTLCQLSTAVFDFVNQQFNNQLRGNENRATNCDTRNIMRSVNATAKHIQAIEKLKQNGRLYMLSDELQATAELRVANPDMPLLELARLHNPPITKSGLNHRLTKIIKESEEN